MKINVAPAPVDISFCNKCFMSYSDKLWHKRTWDTVIYYRCQKSSLSVLNVIVASDLSYSSVTISTTKHFLVSVSMVCIGCRLSICYEVNSCIYSMELHNIQFSCRIKKIFCSKSLSLRIFLVCGISRLFLLVKPIVIVIINLFYHYL